MTIREALENESNFFTSHPIYQSYSERLGIPFLADSMNKILC